MKLTKFSALSHIVLLTCTFTTTAVLADSDSAYSHDSNIGYTTTSWMANVPDGLKLSEISMVGTHDSGSSVSGGDIALTQTMDYVTQLNSGIRVFDIRLRHDNDQFDIYHGISKQLGNYDDVLTAVADFLAANPSETVLMRTGSSGISHGSNTRSYSDTFDEYMSDAVYANFHWTGSSNNPTLDEVRGKFVILINNGGINENHGIQYSVIVEQDAYNLGDNWDLYDKWLDVKDHMEVAEHGDRDTIYMNYLSGSGGSFPYFVASGHSSSGTSAPRLATGLTTPGWNSSYPDFPRVDCIWFFVEICTIAFEGTNILTKDYINKGKAEFVGIIMADFPGKGLIQAVIGLNPVAVDFNHSPILSYGGSQDSSGGATVELGGTGIGIAGNTWKKIALPYLVTENTVLEFDFSSNNEGEIHGIGFDNNNSISSGYTFKVHGTQNWGILDFDYYLSGTTHYVIPVGEYYTGSFESLFFTMDHDSGASGDSLFSNISIYEAD